MPRKPCRTMPADPDSLEERSLEKGALPGETGVKSSFSQRLIAALPYG